MNPAPLLLTIAAAAAVLSLTARAESETATGYELKNRSSFKVDADARIPFWPIGFQRPKLKADGTIAKATVVATGIQLEPGHFSVTSILSGNPALATINGHSFEEGELLPVVYGNERLRVVIRAIREGGVTLEYDGQQIFVPMKRPELGSKRAQQKADAAEFSIKIGPSAPAAKK
jgi:hypothetical protein